MLKKLGRHFRARKTRDISAQPAARKLRFEPLESRFLLSAEVAIPPPDPNQDEAHQQTLEQTEISQALVLEEQQQVQILALDPSVSDGQPDSELADTTIEEQSESDASADSAEAVAVDEDNAAGDATAENAEIAENKADPSAETIVAAQNTDAAIASASLNIQPPREIVFIDPGVEDYQALLDSLFNTSDQQAQSNSITASDNGGELVAEITNNSEVTQGDDTGLLSLADDEGLLLQDSYAFSDNATFINDDVLVVVLDANRNGIDQISEVLDTYEGIAAVHILSHGSNANVRLGNANLNNAKLKQYSEQLKRWGSTLTQDGDILLYGCDVAEGATGVNFVQSLAEITGADIAASNDDTGSAALGGDWDLEISTGVIETLPLVSADMGEVYAYLLADYPIAGTADADTFTVTADSVQRSDVATATNFVAGDNVAVNATTLADTSGTTGDDVINIDAFPTAQQLTPALGSFLVYGGDGNDTLDFSAISADLNFSFNSSGEVIVSDGTSSLTAVDIETIITGSGNNEFVFAPGAVTNGTVTITGSGNDSLDFTTYDGILTFSENTISNADASLSIVHSGIDTIAANLDQIDISASALTLVDGLEDLVAWAGDLQQESEIGQTLSGLGANVGVNLGNAIDIAESIDQLRLEIKALVDSRLDAGDIIFAQDIQDVIDGFNQVDIQYVDRAILGDVFDPVMTTADSFVFGIDVTENGTSITDSISVQGNADLATFIDNINAAINASETLRGTLTAVEVTQDDGGTVKSRLAFQVSSPDVSEFSLTTNATGSEILGLATNATIADLDSELQDVGALSVGASGVSTDLSFVGGLAELVFNLDYNAIRNSDFNIDLGKAAEDLGLNFDASATINVSSELNAGLGLGLSLASSADFFFNLDDLSLEAVAGPLTLDSSVNIGFLAATATGDVQFQASVSTSTLDHVDPTTSTMPTVSVDTQDFDLDLTINIDEGRVSGLETFNEAGNELTIGLVDGDPFEGRDLEITFGNFDNLGQFSEFNAASFISQIGTVRDWFGSVAESNLLAETDIPFTDAGLDAVLDLAGVVESTLLYDESGDGEDDETTLVVDLRDALADANLDDKLRVEGDGSRITFIAIDSAIGNISVGNGASLGFDGSEVFADDQLTGSSDALIVFGSNVTFSLSLTENGLTKQYSVTVSADTTANNETIGNDHARLLDENGEPTFTTTQELAEKLFEIIGIDDNVDAVYDSDSKRLTFALTFNPVEYQVDVPVDFNFDLSPIGNIGTTGSPEISLGAGIDLSLTLGLDLSDTPEGTQELTTTTNLIDLNGIDSLAEAIKTEFSLSPQQMPSASLANADSVDISIINSGAVMTGSPRLTFSDSGDADTIVRSGGSWLDDDFTIGQTIVITGTSNNNGSFTIEDISADGLTLTLASGDELEDEVKSGAEVKGSAPELTENPALSFFTDGTIGREDGSWIEDGFQHPDSSFVDYIIIDGAGANNGVYQIDAISADGRTLTLVGATLVEMTDVENVTVTVPDRIKINSGGNWTTDNFTSGQLISISGTELNNRTFLIADILESGTLLMLSASSDASTENLVNDANLSVTGGAVIRLSEDAVFSIDGVEVTVLAQTAGEVSFVSATSDNNNLLDLVNDINSALEEAGLDNRFEAELINGQILLTAKTELQDNPVLSFSVADNTISRDPDEGSWLDDGFAIGQTIRLTGSTNNDDVAYTVVDVDDGILTLSSGQILNAEADSRNIEIIGTSAFTLTTAAGNTANTEIGFATSQTADSADLLITISDESIEAYRVTLDGVTTIQDVIDAIEAQTDGNVKVAIDPDSESGLRLTQVPALTGNPRLSFDATGNAIIREDGRDWSDDQFAIGQTIRVSEAGDDNNGIYTIVNIVDIDGENALVVTRVGGGTVATDQQSIKDVLITLAGDEMFRVEAVNGSKAAAKLGIQKLDATTDVDGNGRIEVEDSDGVIIGEAIAGVSILDRVFIQDPTVTGRVFLDALDDEATARADDGIVVTADFGFVSVDLIGSGGFDVALTLGMTDPTPDIEGISVNELIKSLDHIESIVSAPTIGGAQVSGESLAFSGSTIVRTSTAAWDDFSVGEYISVSGADEQNNGKYLITAVSGSVLTLETDEDFITETITTATVLNEIGIFELALEVNPDLGLISDEDVTLTLALFDFGNPFLDEDFSSDQFEVDEDERTLTLDGDWTDRIEPGAKIVIGLAAVEFDNADADTGNDVIKISDSSFSLAGDQRGRFELGGKVTAELLDGAVSSTASSKIKTINYNEGTDITTITLQDDALENTLVNVSITTRDASTRVVTVSYDEADNKTTITVVDAVLAEDALSLSIDTPRELDYLLELPDLGDLVKFDQIGISQIIDGLIELSNFLSDFEAFGFLEDPIPVINVSVNDLLSFADRFDAAVQEANNNPAGTLQVLENKLREALGVPSGIDTDVLGFTGEQISASGVLTGLVMSDAEVADMTDNIVFLMSLDNGLTQLIQVATADANTIDELVININAALSAAFASNVQARKTVDDEIEFFTPDSRALSLSNPIDLSIYEDGDLQLFRIDFGLGTGFTEGLNIEFDLGDAGVLSGSAGLQASGSVDFALSLGIDLDNPEDIYLFDSSINGQLEAIGDDISFRAGIGPVGVFIDDGNVSIGGDLDGKLFTLGLDFDGDSSSRDGYKLISDVDLDADFSAELSGAIDVDLPVYFPSETLHKGMVVFDTLLSVGASGDLVSDSNLGAENPDGVDIEIDDLFSFDLSELTLMDNMLLAVDGLDTFLEGLQDTLDGEVFGVPLPLVGDKLSDGARFIEDLREDFIEPFRDAIEGLTEQDENIVSSLLFDLLGPSGIGLLLDSNDDELISIDDIILDTNIDEADGNLDNDYMQWNMQLGQVLELGSGISLDLGIPGLGLETEGDVNVDLDWNLDFGFGISFEEAFYLDISDSSELEVGLEVSLPDFGLSGELAFLQLDIEGNQNAEGEDISLFRAIFGVDVFNNTDENDDRLAFYELGNLGLDAGIAGEAIVDLNLELKINSDLAPGISGVFPKIVTDFFLDWSLDADDSEDGLQLVSFSDLSANLVRDGLQLVEFQDVSLDLGSFISDFVDPILSTVQTVTAPLQPIVDFLTTRLPVISDLGPEMTVLDLAALTGEVNTGFIESIADLITFINAIPDDAETVLLNFGNFTIFSRLDNPDLDLTDISSDVKNNVTIPTGRVGEEEVPDGADEAEADKTSSFTDKLKASGDFDFPIITDPTQIFNILLGNDAVLMTFDLQPLIADFAYKQSFPVYGPLAVAIIGEMAVEADFAFGFDTSGISAFADSGFRNAELIFNGFYVSDTDLPTGEGNDVPELTLSGGLGAAAELNLGVASAGVGGGVYLDVLFDLFDPNRDGKVRVPEIINSILNESRYGSPALAPLALFDVSGEIFAKLFAYIEFLFFEREFDITPPITLVDFDIPFTRAPTLASDIGEGVLQINMGEFAAQRLNNNIIDGDETFVISGSGNTVTVSATFGGDTFVQTYQNVSKILALGGEGDDVIDLTGLVSSSIEFELDGGVGNDRILLSSSTSGNAVIDGGIGDDIIVGGDGDDRIYGGAGNDVITGGNGDDSIFGDDGEIVFQEDEDGEILTDGFGNELIDYTRSRVNLTDGDDVITGNAGDDWIFGGGGEDDIQGGENDDLIIGDGGILREVLEITARSEVSAYALDDDAAFEFIIDGESVALTLLAANTSGNTDIEDLIVSLNAQLAEDGIDDLIVASSDGERLQFTAEPGVLEIRVKGANDVTTSVLGFTSFFKKSVSLDDINRGQGVADTLSGGDGNDLIYGGRGDDTMFGNADDDQLFGGDGFDLMYGNAGDDRLFGGDDNDDISGGAGDDHIEGDAGNDNLWGDWMVDETVAGDAGVDSIWGGTGGDTIFGGDGDDFLFGESDPDIIFGEAGDDTLDGGHGADNIFGGVDDDVIVSSLGDDFIDGGSGSDDVTIDTQGGDLSSLVTVFDSGGAIGDGTDTLLVNGTDNTDQFLLRAASAEIFDASLNDVNLALADIEDMLVNMGISKTLQLDLSTLPPRAFIAHLNNDDNAERVNYYDNLESIIVNTLDGDDYVVSDNTNAEVTINGGDGDDLFQIGQIFNSPRDQDVGINEYDVFDTVQTTRGFLSNGVNAPMTINGEDGADSFVVFRNLAVLTLNGGDGDDEFLVKAFALEGSVEDTERDLTDITGAGGADLIQYAVNAPVGINGGDGLDTVVVLGTEFGDDFVVTEDGVYGAGLNVSFAGIEILKLDTAEGNDRIFVLSTGADHITEIFAGEGSDAFFIAGDTPPVTSQDLLGHSGIITHVASSDDDSFDDVNVDGISANVGDDDEPFIRIIKDDGPLRITEDGLLVATYSVVLTREPRNQVGITAIAPRPSPNEASNGIEYITVNGEQAEQLIFDSTNWYIPQIIEVAAVQDLAYEGNHIATINHVVTQFPVPDEPNYEQMAVPSVNIEIIDDDLPGLVITQSDGETRVIEGATFGDAAPFADEYTIRLNQQPGSDVTVSLVNEDGQLQFEQTTFTFTPINWNIVQTVRVIAADDTANEGLHYGYVQHEVSSAQADVDLATVNSFAATITAEARSTVLLDYTPVTISSVQVGTELFGSDRYSLNDKELTLLGEDGEPLVVTDEITVSYTYTKPGFQNVVTETVAVEIGDDDAPGVMILQSGGSTNVIEADDATPGSTSAPFTDQYQVVLTARPDADVVIDVTPQVTQTSARPPFVFSADASNVAVTELGFDSVSDSTISLTSGNPAPDDGQLSGDLVFTIDLTPDDSSDAAVEVTLAQADMAEYTSIDNLVEGINAALADAGLEEQIIAVRDESRIVIAKVAEAPREQVSVSAATLTFTPDNWNIPQIVTVTAINDDVVDGGETKVFAPVEQTVARIQGPLIINGGGGEGSDAGLGDDPLLMSGESNDVGNVVEIPLDEQGDPITDQVVLNENDIDKLGPTYFQSLDTFEDGDEDDDTAAKIILRITSGPGEGQERVVVARNGNTFILAEAWDSDDLPDSESGYIFIRELASVNEAEQVDVATVFHNESVADNVGTLTATRLYGLGMGPDIVVDDVTWGGGITYNNLENLTIHMGNGDDILSVYGAQNREDFRTVTIVNTGAGDDQLLVDIEAETDSVVSGTVSASRSSHLQDTDADFETTGRGLSGYLVRVTDVNGNVQERTILFNDNDTLYLNETWINPPQAGDSYEIIRQASGLISINTQAGDDVIDASASTASLIAFGGLGDDLIIGGEGDDVLIGDRGLIDYSDDDGSLITRLGSSDIPAPLQDNPDDPDNPNVIFRQTDGVFRDPDFIRSIEPNSGGDDELHGGGGADLLIGGAFADTLFGDAGNDVLIGDGGQQVFLGANRTSFETIDNFIGGNDVLDGGAGNDIMFGAFGNDGFEANFDEDIVLGEYGRITLRANAVESIVRLGQGPLDLAASTLFSLYGTEFEEAEGVKTFAGSDALEKISRTKMTSLVVETEQSIETMRAEGGFTNHHTPLPEEKPAIPEQHEVIRNDTLWRLADIYLGDAERWPEIWKLNPDIENPDLILPGTEIKLPRQPANNNIPELPENDVQGRNQWLPDEMSAEQLALAGIGVLGLQAMRNKKSAYDSDGAFVFDSKRCQLQPYYQGNKNTDSDTVIDWDADYTSRSNVN